MNSIISFLIQGLELDIKFWNFHIAHWLNISLWHFTRIFRLIHYWCFELYPPSLSLSLRIFLVWILMYILAVLQICRRNSSFSIQRAVSRRSQPSSLLHARVLHSAQDCDLMLRSMIHHNLIWPWGQRSINQTKQQHVIQKIDQPWPSS